MGRMLIVEFDDNDKPIFEEAVHFFQSIAGFSKVTLLDKNILSIPGLEINLEQRTACINEQKVHLTVKEFDLLCMLVINKGRVVTYERIYENIWGGTPGECTNRIINYHIRNIRKKLKGESQEPSFVIQCVREVGYSFLESQT